jgi:DNA invertase Pin-like site-specific DNA recombinase
MMVSAREKIASSHLERLAIVYLRQSSPRQVRENFRSTERQYALAEEAVRLGWESERVVVVDGDLGISGRFSDTQAREGYKELVARVCLGEVGAIFGLEIARLARSSAELQRLLEFCGLTDTLVVDTDGIYDLQDFNDRLLLGLKAQMSEAELHIITSRLQGAKRAAAERGELRFPLPVGYVYDDEGQSVIDPDEEVQAAIADLFAAFAKTGSAYGVVGAFKGRRFPKRAYGGAWAGELRWGELTHPRVLGVLSNPCYAGGVRVRPLPLAPGGQAGRHDHDQDHRAAPRRMAGRDPRSSSWLHQLGGVSGQRAAACGQRHALWSAPAAGVPRDLPGDLALRRLWAVDDHASPPRGQLLRMRPRARRPRQHARLSVGQSGCG